MNYWRVTKYNPKYRQGNAYLHEEWTSVSDIGNYFNDTEFTLDSYLKCEKQYINAVVLAMQRAGIEYLEINEMDKNRYKEYQDIPKQLAEDFYESLYNGAHVHIDDIALLMKLMLREIVWGKLSNENFFVHFGYDYYMYFGISEEASSIKEEIEDNGLFVENMKSPYMD